MNRKGQVSTTSLNVVIRQVEWLWLVYLATSWIFKLNRSVLSWIRQWVGSALWNGTFWLRLLLKLIKDGRLGVVRHRISINSYAEKRNMRRLTAENDTAKMHNVTYTIILLHIVMVSRNAANKAQTYKISLRFCSRHTLRTTYFHSSRNWKWHCTASC